MGSSRVSRVLAAVGVLGAFTVLPSAWDVRAETADGPTVAPLISGTTSWVGGTHVWTDYVYDDRGPTATAPAAYPAEAAPGNAADLVQLELALDGDDLQVQALLETLVDPALPLLGVGLDVDGDPHTGAPAVPGGRWQMAGTPLGLERLLLIDAAGTQVLAPEGDGWVQVASAPSVVDPVGNTMSAAVPVAGLAEAGSTWRVVGLLGLALDGHSWADGAGAIHDLAYVSDPSLTAFQSNAQAAVLSGVADAAGAVATIAIDDLRSERTELAQPVAGVPNTFLYRSELDLGEGIRTGTSKYAGPYQPYLVYFTENLPARPGLLVYLHGTGGTHLQSRATVMTPETAVMVAPLGRSENGAINAEGIAARATDVLAGSEHVFDGPSEQDVLDVVDDASARFDVDPDRVVLTGYSVGGVGTFRMAQLHPDKWAGAIPVVGAHHLGVFTVYRDLGGLPRQLPRAMENVRNVPMRLAMSRADELQVAVGAVQPDRAAVELDLLDYDYRYWSLSRRMHSGWPLELLKCEVASLLERGRVVNPARVVYSQEPVLVTNDPETGLRFDRNAAYWMSDMVVPATAEKGTVDITSLARADRQPVVERVDGVHQNLTAGRDMCGANETARTDDVWTELGKKWTGHDPQLVSNGMTAVLTQVTSVELDLVRMSLDVGEPLRLDDTSDRESHLRLAGPWTGAVTVERNGAAPVSVCPVDGVVEVIVPSGTSSIVVKPGAAGC